MNLIFLTLAGALAFNSTLLDVAQVRAESQTAYRITRPAEKYDCRLGVPHGYAHLIDQEIYFLPEGGGLFGPFLVVDVEADVHAGRMAQAGLAADVDCPKMVHRAGRLAQREKPK